MKSIMKYPILCCIMAVLAFSSCSKSNKEGRLIPSEASFVIHFNGESLTSKLPWEEIRKNELMQEAMEDSTATALMKSVMDNPENTGIDISKDLFIFLVNDSAGGYFAAMGTLKDAGKFKKFTKEASKESTVESEKNGISFSATKDLTTAWNKEKFLFVADAKMNRNSYASLYDTSVAPTPEVKRDWNLVAENIFNLKEEKSLGKEEKFTALMKEKGDMHFWLNTEAFYTGYRDNPGMAALSMINLSKIYNGSRVTGTVSFDDGKINADFKSYSGKEMTELEKKYSGDKINAEMVKSIPSKDVAALFAFNFKPEGLREYLKLLGVEGFANMGTAMLGFNTDDFIKANKGDILLALTDLKQDSSGKPDFSVIFSASIGDKPSFNKLVAAGNKIGKERFGTDNSPSIFHNMNDKYFALGNKQQHVDTYLKGSSNTDFDFFDKIAGSAGGGYINFQYILKSMGESAKKDSFDLAMYNATLTMWDNMIAYGGGFKSGGSVQHFEINLVDKKTNSLKQLNNYLGTLGIIQKKRDAQYRSSMFDENTTVEPAPAIQ